VDGDIPSPDGAGEAEKETRVSDWHYAVGDKESGPVPEEQILALLHAGELHPDDLVWTDTMEDWAPAGTVFDMPAQEPIPEETDEPVAYGQPEPVSPPPPPGTAAAPPPIGQAAGSTLNPLAIASLVISVASMVTCSLLGIVGVVCGHMALGQIRKEPERFHGKGLAVAGLVLGYLWIVASLLFALVAAAVLILSGPGH
jgi:Domain of unknown function (DUF4190)/GYF domain 2